MASDADGERGEVVGAFTVDGDWIEREPGGDWHHYQSEEGALSPTDSELEASEQVVVHYVNTDGEDVYFTVWDGFDEDYDVDDAIVDHEDQYGEAA